MHQDTRERDPWLKRSVLGAFWRRTSIIVIDAADFGFSGFVR
jgi:hypothetical protein